MQSFKKLVDKWYDGESQLQNNFARSENISYIEILVSPSITRETLRMLGQLQILHLISPYSNDGRSALILPSTSSSSSTSSAPSGLEQKRVMNSCQALLSRLRRLSTSIEQCKIPLPSPFTASELSQSTVDAHLLTLRSDPSSIFNGVGEWINTIEQEEKTHLQFLNQTNLSLTLSIKLLLTLFMMKNMMEDLLNKRFQWRVQSNGSKFALARRSSQQTSRSRSAGPQSQSNAYGSIPSATERSSYDNSGDSAQTHSVEPLDVETMLYSYDAPLPNQYESYSNRSDPQILRNQADSSLDRFLESHQSSTNIITLYGCVATSTKNILNTTIQRLSRGNVYISWSDFSFQDQQTLLSEIVSSFFLGQQQEEEQAHGQSGMNSSFRPLDEFSRQTSHFDGLDSYTTSAPNESIRQRDLIMKYLPLSLDQFRLPIFDTLDSQSDTDQSKNPFSSHSAFKGSNQSDSSEENQPPPLSSFFLVFPYSQQLYTKIMKVCGIYNVQFFKIPSPSSGLQNDLTITRSGQTSPHPLRSNSGRMYSSQHVFEERDMYLDLLDKYNTLIERVQHSIYRLLYTRVTTFKALYQLYLDCCSYKYDLLGNIVEPLHHTSSSSSPLHASTISPSQQSNHSQILQISTCSALMIEELSILQGEQFLIPFTPPTVTTTPTFLSTTNALASGLSTPSNTISYRSPMANAQYASQHISQLSILRAFIRTNSINFLNEQFMLFDDGCEDGFNVKPFFFFIHTYSRTWITTPSNVRSNPQLFAKIVQHQHQTDPKSRKNTTNNNNNDDDNVTSSDPFTQLTTTSDPFSTAVKKKFSYPTTENPNPAFQIPPEPPTLFPALPLFLPAQELVNTYAIPSYKEFNPALLTIVMFPMLFAIMFGDIIHGFMMLCAACSLYYFAYHLPSDPILPQVDIAGRFQGTSGRHSDDHAETDALLNNDESHDNNGTLTNKVGPVDKYTLQSPLSSPIAISTHFYEHLYQTVLQHPVYKAVSMRQGVIVWFILIAFLSMYVGFIYNDAASNPLFLFSSYLHEQHNLDHIDYKNYTVYPFGLDPGWYHTGQELTFLNSFKMKMAIIIGILHLYSGIICSFMNHLFFKHFEHIIFSTIPQLLLLTCTFGYMSCLIIYKWCTDYGYWSTTDIKWYPQSIIQTMINMFISPPFRSIPQEELIFSYQSLVQSICVVVVLLCVPVLFCAEPLYTNFLHKKWRKSQKIDDMEYSDKYDDGSHVDGLFMQTNSGYGGKKEEKQLFLSPRNSPGGSKDQLNNSGSYNTFDRSESGDSNTEGELSDDLFGLVAHAHSKPSRSAPNKGSVDAGLNLQSLSSTPSEDGADFQPVEKKHVDQSPLLATGQTKSSDTHLSHHEEAGSEEDELNPFSMHYNIGTHFVHHGIHSIEFVLGIVSNTASYLRLWALSLAHAQLSNVFWSQLITNLGLHADSSPIVLCIAMMVWTFSTVGVLLLMDAMECLLHGVRLMWVEFQSKFYQGQGYLFNPYSLYPESLLRGREGGM